MLIDQAILASVHAGETFPTIRVFTWNKPIVSLGRLQSLEAARSEYPEASFVRRPTGGNAVSHGDDLTLSLTVSERKLWSGEDGAAKGVLSSYFLLLEGMIAALRDSGIDARCGAEWGVVVFPPTASRGSDAAMSTTARRSLNCSVARSGARRDDTAADVSATVSERRYFLSNVLVIDQAALSGQSLNYILA